MVEAAEREPARLAAALLALREGAALSSLDDRALLAARGTDRASFLQGMLSNDVARLAPGEGAHALLLTEQGRVVAEMAVLALPEVFWLEMPAAARPRVREALERYVVADDVELDDLAASGLAVRGARAAAVLGEVAGPHASGLAALDEGAHLEMEHAGAALRVVRLRDSGLDGFHLWSLDAAAIDAVASALLARGAHRVADDVFEAQRISAGWARHDVDYGPQTLAAEIPSFARAVSYRKGCYLGQEVMERVAARGHVNWLLVRLTADGGSSFSVGAMVKDADAEVGSVTSVARSGEAVVALARVRAKAAEAGTRLLVEQGDGTTPVVVDTIPVQP